MTTRSFSSPLRASYAGEAARCNCRRVCVRLSVCLSLKRRIRNLCSLIGIRVTVSPEVIIFGGNLTLIFGRGSSFTIAEFWCLEVDN